MLNSSSPSTGDQPQRLAQGARATRRVHASRGRASRLVRLDRPRASREDALVGRPALPSPRNGGRRLKLRGRGAIRRMSLHSTGQPYLIRNKSTFNIKRQAEKVQEHQENLGAGTLMASVEGALSSNNKQPSLPGMC